jgi:hypothetical protein
MPIAAGTLMDAASAHSAIPQTGWRERAAVMPARSRPTMSASLCAPPTSASSVSGLRTASTNAGPASLPKERASLGMQYAISATPTTDCTRRSSTVISA